MATKSLLHQMATLVLMVCVNHQVYALEQNASKTPCSNVEPISNHVIQTSEPLNLSLEDVKTIRDFAELGSPRAQVILGKELFLGDRVTQNLPDALTWFCRAAMQTSSFDHTNVSRAQYNIGVIFANGWGVQKDNSVAIYWLERAAEEELTGKGNALAQLRLGLMYFEDKETGGKQKAFKWLLTSATNDHPPAAAVFNVALSYKLGVGVKKNYKQARNWFLKADKLRVPLASFNLYLLYAQGLGVKQDSSKALNWLRRAVELHDSTAETLTSRNMTDWSSSDMAKITSHAHQWQSEPDAIMADIYKNN